MATLQEIEAEIAKRQGSNQQPVNQQAQHRKELFSDLDVLQSQIDEAKKQRMIQAGYDNANAGIIEPLLSIGSGALAESVSGLVGGASLLGTDSKNAEGIVSGIQDAMTYQSRSESAKQNMQAIGESAPMQYLGDELKSYEQGLSSVATGAVKSLGGDVESQALAHSIATAVPTALLEGAGLKGVGKVRGAKKVTGITDEVADKLSNAGIDINNLSDEGIAKIQKKAATLSTEQSERAKLFKDLDIPTVKSRITQEQGDFLSERQLARDAGNKDSALLQERRAAESAGFQDASQRLIDKLGMPADAGAVIKEALNARVKSVAKKTTEAYKKLGELSEGNSIPIIGTQILNKLNDGKVSGMAGRLNEAERQGLNDLFIEYGLDTNPKRVESWLDGRKSIGGAITGKSEITPLTLSNAEEFRQALSGMSGFDVSPSLRGVAGALKRGVDEELSIMDKSLKSSVKGTIGDIAGDVLSAAGRARALFRGKKSLETTDGVIGRLTRGKARTPDEPLVLASEVTKKLLSDTKEGAIENVARVVGQLERSGKRGRKAVALLQSSVVADLLNSGVAITKLPDGTRQWMGNQFAKRYDKINKNGKIDRIFKNNPEDLKTLQDLRKAGELTQAPSDVARASGTSDDLLNDILRSPKVKAALNFGYGAGEVVDKAAKTASSRATKKAVKRAVSATPDDEIIIQQVRRLYPNLGAVLAPSQLRKEK